MITNNFVIKRDEEDDINHWYEGMKTVFLFNSFDSPLMIWHWLHV